MLYNHRDVPSPIVEVRTGDFDGDGVVDILTLHSVPKDSSCYTARLHWCTVTGNGGVTVSSK